MIAAGTPSWLVGSFNGQYFVGTPWFTWIKSAERPVASGAAPKEIHPSDWSSGFNDAMPKLFISYRRSDSSDVTGRLFDRMKDHFGRDNVFIDIDGIPFGVDFRKHLSEAVGKCDVLLAVIGNHWLDAAQEDGQQKNRRLDDLQDWVRIEIEAALARGIPVIPVLVGQSSMPRDKDLPGDLKELAYRNAAEVRSGRDFDDHVGRLIRGLERLQGKKRELQEDL